MRARRFPSVAATGLALTIALALGACAAGDDDGTDAGGPSSTGAPQTTTTTAARPARYEVTVVEETYVDTSRPTMANGDFAGASERTLRVKLHVPQGDGPFPLVLWSHGFIAVPDTYDELGTELAARGYLVAMPQYPLSNGTAPGGPTVHDVVHQPADASFVIDEVLADGEDPDSPLHGLVDGDRIGTGGHSLGGITTLGFFNSCCTDDRIDAAVPVAGAMRGFQGEWFPDGVPPLLLVHGDHDELVPYASSREAYALAGAPKFLLTMIGGRHADLIFRDDDHRRVAWGAIAAFFDAYVRGDEDALTTLRGLGATDGVATLEEATT